MENAINTLHLSGKIVGTPVVGHEAFGEKFYYLTLGVPRLSGAQDLLLLAEGLVNEGIPARVVEKIFYKNARRFFRENL